MIVEYTSEAEIAPNASAWIYVQPLETARLFELVIESPGLIVDEVRGGGCFLRPPQLDIPRELVRRLPTIHAGVPVGALIRNRTPEPVRARLRWRFARLFPL